MTNTLLTEEQVLSRLDIPDFRHLSKDKVMTFFSMLPNMDPEVAKKVIEQFPSYANAVRAVASDFKSIIDKALSDNAESTKAYYQNCNTIIVALSKMLERDDLTFEEKQYIIEKMLEVEAHIREKDTENKKHGIRIVTIAFLGLFAVVAGLAAALGANSSFTLPSLKSKKSDQDEDKNDD